MKRDQVFRLLPMAGFMLEHVGGNRWKVGVAIPEMRGVPLDDQIADEPWLIRFAERFYQAYVDFVRQKVAGIACGDRGEDRRQVIGQEQDQW